MPILMRLVPVFDKAELVALAVRGLEPPWRYLESFDLDGDDGRGVINLTDDPAKAMRFPSLLEAVNTWRRPSTKIPRRPDGGINRPLTAYHATFQYVDVEEMPDGKTPSQ